MIDLFNVCYQKVVMPKFIISHVLKKYVWITGGGVCVKRDCSRCNVHGGVKAGRTLAKGI